MLPVADALPLQLSRALVGYNIRFVEQFLALMRKPSRVSALSAATGCSVEDLVNIAKTVQREWPELKVPEPSGREYGLGAGKRGDWEHRRAS